MDAPPESTPTAEAPLIARLRAGDASAYEALVRKHMPVLLRVARRFMKSEEDARDVVQESFINAFKSIDKFAANAQLSTWLHRIVVNTALMQLRTQKRRREEDIEDHLPKFASDGHAILPAQPWSENAETTLARTELSNVVRTSIDQLPDTYREVLLMRDIEELSTEETAKMLGITANAVKVRLHRARQALRTLLDPYMRSANDV